MTRRFGPYEDYPQTDQAVLANLDFWLIDSEREAGHQRYLRYRQNYSAASAYLFAERDRYYDVLAALVALRSKFRLLVRVCVALAVLLCLLLLGLAFFVFISRTG